MLTEHPDNVVPLVHTRKVKIIPYFRWYDLWIGAYLDTNERAVYICPIPMFGVRISRG